MKNIMGENVKKKKNKSSKVSMTMCCLAGVTEYGQRTAKQNNTQWCGISFAKTMRWIKEKLIENDKCFMDES